MIQRFRVICSLTAASALSDEDRTEIVTNVIPMALQRDRGIHEGLAFTSDMHGRVWQVVVDLQEGWIKIMDKDEFEKAMKEAIQAN